MGEWIIEPGPAQLRAGSPRWWFTSRTTGRIVVAQAPNLALAVFALASVAGRLLADHHTTADSVRRGQRGHHLLEPR